MDNQYAENNRLVIFTDKYVMASYSNIDFGIYIPEINKVMCLCCGRMMGMDEIRILYDYKDLDYVETAIAENFLKYVPKDNPNYSEIMNGDI